MNSSCCFFLTHSETGACPLYKACSTIRSTNLRGILVWSYHSDASFLPVQNKNDYNSKVWPKTGCWVSSFIKYIISSQYSLGIFWWHCFAQSFQCVHCPSFMVCLLSTLSLPETGIQTYKHTCAWIQLLFQLLSAKYHHHCYLARQESSRVNSVM